MNFINPHNHADISVFWGEYQFSYICFTLLWNILHILDIIMSASDPRIRKLKIQTGVVKRCGKEKVSYRKEANQQKEKVEKMKAEGREEIEIKKMNECVQESLMMIPDCHRRLEKAVTDLQNLIEELEPDFGNQDLKEGEAPPGHKEMSDAKTALKDSEEHLKAE